MPKSLQSPDVEVAEVIVSEILRWDPLLVIGVRQIADQVAAVPAHLAAERREVLGPRAQVVEVDVPHVDPLGPAHVQQPEPVPVGEQLLAEVIVGAEADHPQAEAAGRQVPADARPVEERHGPPQ